MNSDNRNNKSCLPCQNKNFEYFIRKFSNNLNLAICKNCYDNLGKEKAEYIQQKDYRKYIEEELRKIYEINKLVDELNDNKILTQDQISFLSQFKEKFIEINKIVGEIEQGNPQSITKLLFLIPDLQSRQYHDFLLTLQLGKEINLFGQINIEKFRTQQDQIFDEDFITYIRKLLLKSVKNEINKEIVESIQNCIDFPIFLQIFGDSLNNPQQQDSLKQNYYGYLNKEKVKTGLGFWNDKNQLYFGIFYQDNFLWGIKVIIESITQFTLYKGYFTKVQQNDRENFLINGIGEMFSTDENDTCHQYIGKFLNEKRQGEGTYFWKSKDHKVLAKYTGSWQNDLYHGQGTLNISDQNISIQGEFNDGFPIFENCQITGKNILQQVLRDYVTQQKQQTQENTLPKQKYMPPPNLIGPQLKQNQPQNILPINKYPPPQQQPGPFQSIQKLATQPNLLIQPPPPIANSNQPQVLKFNPKTFNQGNFQEK